MIMNDAVKVIGGLLVAGLAIAFVILLNLALFALMGVCGAWLWNAYLVPVTELPLIAWWEFALGLLVLRWILAYLLPRRS
jgi:hypothetical protein